MNETHHPDGATETPLPPNNERVWMPEPSILPASETTPPVAVGLRNDAAAGAHLTIDRPADSAAPAARQQGERVSATQEALHAKARSFRETRDAWIEGLRSTLRRTPMGSVLAALAVGVVLTRLVRIKR